MDMDGLTIKKPGTVTWDAASLGEIMLRLDPGDGRIHTAREFRVWEGGGEVDTPLDYGDYYFLEALLRL